MSDKKVNSAVLENVRLVFRNFSGKEGKYNREGDRNFSVLLDVDTADAMMKDGWNVKWLKPREEEDEPQAYLQVAVNFNGRPPRITLVTSRGKTALDESMVDILDWADIMPSDLIVRPYHWEVNGKTGVKAYLQSLYAIIREDQLDLKYADVPDSASSSLITEEEEF